MGIQNLARGLVIRYTTETNVLTNEILIKAGIFCAIELLMSLIKS